MIVMRSYLTEKQRNVPVLFGKTEVLRGENAAMFSLGLVPNASSYFWPMIVSLLLNIAVSGLLLLLVWKAVERVYF